MSIGDELVRGRRPDHGGQLIARALCSLGHQPRQVACVPSEPGELAALLGEAAGRCEALIVAGAPEAAARALAGAQARTFFLPGSGPELEVALERDVLPALESLGPRRASARCVLRVFPRTEPEVRELLADLQDREGGLTLEVSQAHEGPEVEVAIQTFAASSRQALARARRAGVEVCTRLGHDVHGPLGQDLPTAVVEALLARGWTLAVVEVGTGGAVPDSLARSPESARVLRLGLVLGREGLPPDLLGLSLEEVSGGEAVSAEAATALASGVRSLGRAELGLSITAQLGPRGGTRERPVGLVHFALAGPGGVRQQCRRFGSLSRPGLRQWSAATALRLVLDRCREKGV